jgi:phosphatidylglycerol:prolipoprotein diacylglycerol transferase
MMPFLHLGPVLVPTYGLMLALAMLVAYYILRADLARRGIAPRESSAAEAFIAVPCLAGIMGAKMYAVLETPRELFADPLGQLFSRYGLTFTGGLIAGFLAFVWLARRRNIALLDMLDAGATPVALGYGIGRIGCLLAGDGDYGIPTSLPWGMSFPHGLVPTTQRVHPTPIYEFIVACAIAWLLWRLGTRQIQQRAAHGAKSPSLITTGIAAKGAVFAVYLVLSGVARFLVEFIRINPRVLFGMTNAQIASLLSIAVGMALWLHSSRSANA